MSPSSEARDMYDVVTGFPGMLMEACQIAVESVKWGTGQQIAPASGTFYVQAPATRSAGLCPLVGPSFFGTAPQENVRKGADQEPNTAKRRNCQIAGWHIAGRDIARLPYLDMLI